MTETLYLLDGHAIAYRAYFAITAGGDGSRWMTPEGEPTAGTFGFASILLRLLEKKGWTGWAKPLSPAGTATLTMYMVPYVFDSFWDFFTPTIPLWLTGWVGVGKCVLFSALCVFCTWCLGKVGIKLKI